ncbi:MAG: hypothetical protein H8K07_08815 [Nitrospira sp.]|nr:hypothetical protein [Nitrospira sp.]
MTHWEAAAKFIAGNLLVVLLMTSCGTNDSSNDSSSPLLPPGVVGTTVQVSVTATDPDGDQLHYRWAATEGTINNVDAAKTTWVVPHGSGLQFAYVVVSDSKGGYIESRAVVLTFDPPTVTSTMAPALTPPAPTGQPGFVWGSVYSASFGRNVYLPGVTVELSNGLSAITDMKGQFFISNVADGTYTATYQFPGRPAATFKTSSVPNSSDLSIGVAAAANDFPTSPSSGRYVQGRADLSDTLFVVGSVRLADHSYCGMRDEFFTHSSAPNLFRGPVSGTAQLLDAGNNPLSSSFPINHYGDFLIVRSPVAANTNAKVRITCEGEVVDSPALILPASGAVKLPATVTLPNNRPMITKMNVLLDGQEIGRPDLPKPRTLFTSMNGTPPRFGDSDLIAEIIHTPGDDAFFTYKGIDTRKSACAYYRAIGAVQGCTDDGFPTGAQLTLAQWRSKFNLSPFPNGNPSNPPAADGQEVRLQYINRSDLNLGRDMQAVKLDNGDIAYNVCNYPGPLDVKHPLAAPKAIGLEMQTDIDRSIQNIHDNLSMIVCVAMDYQVQDGFTRFYTFGPTGQLVLSVSLDGRREKFMPGTCTTCHGGDAYGGQFPDDGSGRPDLKSRWQPFDMANLRFSSIQDMAAANRGIKILNERMVGPRLESITTPRTKELIANWYLNNRPDQNQDFIPSQSPTRDPNIYKKVIQPGCQTCHAAQKANENITDKTKVCGGSPTLEQNHTMTNSLVPFERFWIDPTIPLLLNVGCNDRPLGHPGL